MEKKIDIDWAAVGKKSKEVAQVVGKDTVTGLVFFANCTTGLACFIGNVFADEWKRQKTLQGK